MRIPGLAVVIFLSSGFLAGVSGLGEEGAALKGKIVAPRKFADQIQVAEIKITLNEQVQTDSPPVPQNWSEMTATDQEKWWTEFETSEAGKAFIAEQDKKIAAARTFELKLESDGSFVVYDVPPAVFELYGRMEKEIAGRAYVCEIFGQLEVVPKAEEVALGELEMLVSPVFHAGDPVPPFELQSLDGLSLNLETYKNKLLLINFWSAASPPAGNFQKELQTIVKEFQSNPTLELLAISLDENEEPVREFLNANQQIGQVAVTKGWNHPIVGEFGLHGIPSLWLVDPQGKFLATDLEFGVALRDSGLGLKEIIAAKIERKEIPLKTKSDPSDDDQ